MKFVARLWWTATARRAQEAPAFAVVVLALFVSNGYYLVRGMGAGRVDAADLIGSYVTGIIVVGLLAAAFIPILFRPDPVLDSRRLDLLPLTPRHFYVVRLLGANPLRLLLAVSALVWGLVGVVLLGGGPVLALEVLQLVATVVALLALLEVAEQRLRRVASALLFVVAVFAVMLLVDGVLFYPVFHSEVAAPVLAGLVERTGPYVLLGGGGAFMEELAFTAGACAVAGSAVVLGSRWGGGVPARGGSGQRSGLRRIAERMPVRRTAAFTKELAALARTAAAQTGVFVAAAIAAVAFYANLPILVAGAFLSFLVLSHNPLGPELPYGGHHRYAMIPQRASDVLGFRHMAVVVAVTGVVGIVGVGFLLVRGSTMPLLPLAISWAYGATMYLFATAVGDRVGRRYPKPIRVRDVILRGGFVTPLAWVSLVVVLGAAGAILAGWVVLLGETMGPRVDDLALVYGSLVLSSLTHLIVYAGSIQQHRGTPSALLARD